MSRGYGPPIGPARTCAGQPLGAEAVLAGGYTVPAAPDDDSELWWALPRSRTGVRVIEVIAAYPPVSHPALLE